jgi:hypothetical protein
MNPYYAFVCDKAVGGSSMWHVLWGVPSRMTGKTESLSLKESPVKWIAASGINATLLLRRARLRLANSASVKRLVTVVLVASRQVTT